MAIIEQVQRRAESFTEAFDKLSFRESLNSNLISILEIVQSRYSDIGRISVAMYDPVTDNLKSYLSSEGLDEPLAHFESPLSIFEDLVALKGNPSARIIRDLTRERESYTAKALRNKGFCSSYVIPIFDAERFIGITTFSSTSPRRFEHYRTRLQIDIAAKLIALLVISELYAIQGLQGTAKTLKDVAALRDNETGEHLDRMSRYSRLIARNMAQDKRLDDEYIEDLFQCAPLHDIGKIAIPDNILLKPGRLSEDEFRSMQGHTAYGKEIIEKALDNLKMREKSFSKVLINIVFSHHENWDGSGYPQGLVAEDISLEARIVRVADVYDALISERPYKKAWSQEDVLDYLREQSGRLFDPDCVVAAIACADQFTEIARRFAEPAWQPCEAD